MYIADEKSAVGMVGNPQTRSPFKANPQDLRGSLPDDLRDSHYCEPGCRRKLYPGRQRNASRYRAILELDELAGAQKKWTCR